MNNGFKLIPVLDLKEGIVVQGLKGEIDLAKIENAVKDILFYGRS